jgi:tetratricopeptide (TPR) repeat protein
MRIFILLFILTIQSAIAQKSNYAKEVNSFYSAALTAYNSGNIDEAKSNFTACITSDSSCFEAHLGLGLIAFETSNFNESLKNCEKAKTIRPSDITLLALLGKNYYHLMRFEEAEIALKKVVSLKNSLKDETLYLALTLQKLSKHSEALFYLDRLISELPSNDTYRLNRGLIYLELEMYDEALIDFNQAISLNPNNLSNYIQAGKTALLLNQKEEAKNYINKGYALDQAGTNVDLLLLKGNYFNFIEEFDSASFYYDLAYSRENSDPTILVYQAAVLIDLEDYEAAILKCDAALKINPNLMEAYFNRGIAKEMTRDVEGACSDWQRAFVLGSQRAIEYLNGSVCNE